MRRTESLPHLYKKHFSIRRVQFHLKPFEASTIHKCIGDDFAQLATQIATANPIEKRMFKLWEKNQLLVIISRVKKLENLTFIGPKSLSLQTIKSISFKTNQWDSFIDNFIENLAGRTDTTSIVQFPISQNIYPICRQVMPEDTCPSVFGFYALKNCTIHIGCCINVKKKLQDMNGFCEDVPPSILMGKPWA